ncbi:hypothetical protein [Gilvibacter sp.]|uniref:hypothetical protein n=1 Tax=Gilvibacter sp. TaxID=2729997 RepID=UPI0025C5EA14|nr:hypothetical protein [Gilvibacter sp.]NQX78311.1 hypothetical protein [Gilvibacter sp.]
MESLKRPIQKINLIEGDYSAQETQDMIHAVLNEKINFFKLQLLMDRDKISTHKAKYMEQRIGELEAEKELSRAFINLKGDNRARYRINGTIELELIED